MPPVCRVILLLFYVTILEYAAMLPPSFINSVVAIGHKEPNGAWATEASGFFYGYLIQDDPDEAKRRYHVFLITNWHVIDNHSVVSVRLNPKQAADQGQIFDLPQITDGRPTWFFNKDVDIAGAGINWQFLQDRGIDMNFMTSDTNAADTKKMQEIGVTAGDSIFVIGFPMNLAGQQRNYAIVRPGAIARVNDLLASAAATLLIDSHVFPGNSGGPVILQPSLISIAGTKSNDRAYLLGVVRDYVPYVDVAISPQTRRARVTFEENSGLADVIPVDRINEAIKVWRASLPAAIPQTPLKTVPSAP
jgi:hypothetical protein